jgi:hypothetical protein
MDAKRRHAVSAVCAARFRDGDDVGPVRIPAFSYGGPRPRRGVTSSATGARSGSRMPGPVWPGEAGSTLCQPCKEYAHGNEEKSEEGREEKDRQEGQEEEGRKTQSSSQEKASEEEAGFTQEEARKEKGGPQGRQEKSCEETRQEEGGAGSSGQACGEIRGASTDDGTCCSVGCGGARGENRPESRCCLAVPNRVTALGGSRIVCGRALCRQSPNRRHSALELPVPRLSPTGPRHFTSRLAAEPGRLSPKIFLLCDAARTRAQVSDSAPFFVCLTHGNSFIRLRFSVVSQRRRQSVVQRPSAWSAPEFERVAAEARRSRRERSGQPDAAVQRAGFQQGITSCPVCPMG